MFVSADACFLDPGSVAIACVVETLVPVQHLNAVCASCDAPADVRHRRLGGSRARVRFQHVPAQGRGRAQRRRV